MNLGLEGKRALVTGSSSGIGAEVARMLGQEGCAVVVHGRDRERAEAVAAGIPGAEVAIGDLTTDSGVDAVAQIAGKIDILVNNAGGSVGTSSKQWTDVTADEWVGTFQKNVLAASRMIGLLLPHMKASGWGRIINIASAAGTQPVGLGPDYGAAKGAMLNMTVSLAKSLASSGVTANSISPGFVLTASSARWLGGLPQQMGWGDISLEETERKVTTELVPIPIGRAGRTEEIAYAVCMLASPSSAFIHGANLRVDGGMVPTVN